MSAPGEHVVGSWWYAEEGKMCGPVADSELRGLVQSGRIGLNTLGWREGMEGWRPLGEIESLADLRKEMAPPLPSGDTAVADLPVATAWPRFFARSFDMWWEVTVAAFFVSMFLAIIVGESFLGWLDQPGASGAFSLLCMPVALLMDAVVSTSFGNTPGKALLGLTVTNLDGSRLNFAQAVNRNVRLWVCGYAFGIPLLNLITMILQYNRVSKGAAAAYDEALGFQVHARPISGLRVLAFSASAFVLILFLSCLNSLNT